MPKDSFAQEANRRIDAFIARAGYASDATAVATREFVQKVLGILVEPEPVVVPESVSTSSTEE